MGDPTFTRQFAMAVQEDILRQARERSGTLRERPRRHGGFAWIAALAHRLAVTVHRIAAPRAAL
ncbi:MAG TPA: hypothetical protein VNL35_03335 [Chloroflexota bacterium]|nr:hypothetical protein [Chloroflexota bacterium]